jgi:cytoskeletal protein CcmA (bactofilin family)
MSDFNPDKSNSVYIGVGAEFEGAIHAQGPVVVDGTVVGEIACDELIVGEHGIVEGKVSAITADIYGKVSPAVSVKDALILRSSGRVEGKWVYGAIEVERGAVLNGESDPTGGRSMERQPSDGVPPIYASSADQAVESASVAPPRIASANRNLQPKRLLGKR